MSANKQKQAFGLGRHQPESRETRAEVRLKRKRHQIVRLVFSNPKFAGTVSGAHHDALDSDLYDSATDKRPDLTVYNGSALPSATDTRRGTLLDGIGTFGGKRVAIGRSEDVKAFLDLDEAVDVAGFGAPEFADGVIRPEFSSTRDLARREAGIAEAAPQALARFAEADHVRHHIAQKPARSSAQQNARAVFGLRRHSARMKMRAAQIIAEIQSDRSVSFYDLADAIGVTANSVIAWTKGKGLRGDSLNALAEFTRLSPNQILGIATLPSDWLSKIPEFPVKRKRHQPTNAEYTKPQPPKRLLHLAERLLAAKLERSAAARREMDEEIEMLRALVAAIQEMVGERSSRVS